VAVAVDGPHHDVRTGVGTKTNSRVLDLSFGGAVADAGKLLANQSKNADFAQ
jgi:hypothetical protein